MRIPRRTHDTLPGHAAWIITENPGLVVYLDDGIPADSPAEQAHVRQAQRAWRHRHDRLILLPPIFAGTEGIGWLMRQLRRPTVAAAAAFATAGVALAVVPIVEPHTPTHRPPAAAAPPSRQPTQPPHVAPSHPAAPPKAPGKTQPRRSGPGPVVAVPVSVGLPARGRVRLPRIPPVRVRPPVSVPPVKVPPVTKPPGGPPVSAARCRLIELDVGRLVHICL